MIAMEGPVDAAGHRHRLAIYPGTFDPLHYGHLDIARRAARLFDHLVVAVYEHPAKPVLFSATEREELFRRAVEDLPNVRVERYAGLTVSYARALGATAIVRGLRAISDFEYEYQVALMNRHLAAEVESVYLLTSLGYAYLSSSIVKEVASLGAPLDGLVPTHVAEALAAKFQR